MKSYLNLACVVIGLGSILNVNAAIVPYGVQNDIAVTTVTNVWGWNECYSSRYSATGFPVASIMNKCAGESLMLAARRVGSDTFEVLAAANFSDVTYDTGTGNTTRTANGVEWYFSDSYSWGFAGLGDTVSRRSCDTNGGGERDRLCWHTYNSTMSGGWRAGSFTSLNSSAEWEKVILTSSVISTPPVPVPAAVWLFGSGLIGLIGIAKRKKT